MWGDRQEATQVMRAKCTARAWESDECSLRNGECGGPGPRKYAVYSDRSEPSRVSLGLAVIFVFFTFNSALVPETHTGSKMVKY